MFNNNVTNTNGNNEIFMNKEEGYSSYDDFSERFKEAMKIAFIPEENGEETDIFEKIEYFKKKNNETWSILFPKITTPAAVFAHPFCFLSFVEKTIKNKEKKINPELSEEKNNDFVEITNFLYMVKNEIGSLIGASSDHSFDPLICLRYLRESLRAEFFDAKENKIEFSEEFSDMEKEKFFALELDLCLWHVISEVLDFISCDRRVLKIDFNN